MIKQIFPVPDNLTAVVTVEQTDGTKLWADAAKHGTPVFLALDNRGEVLPHVLKKPGEDEAGPAVQFRPAVRTDCNLRFSLMAGNLGGNNELKFNSLAEPRDDYRSFKAILVQPALGVQYYPFIQSGFYLYGGISLSGSIIQNYKFYYYDNADNSSKKERQVVEGSTYGILPMVQLGLGWSWKLAPNWSLSAEIMIQEGIVDTHYMNLDAWPLDKSQNGKGLELGNSWGKWTDRYGKEHIHWNDGWFQVGLTITYHWRNCEYCRILNNYNNIRPHRQHR